MAKTTATKPRQIKVVNDNGDAWKVSELKAHTYANQVFGAPADHEVKELSEDLKKSGQLNPLDILPDGRILDGRTRLKAAKLAEIEELTVVVHDLNDDEAKEFILESNLLRHHFDKLTVARIYRELKQLSRGTGKKAKDGAGELRKRLGKRFGMSGRTLDRYEKLLETPMGLQLAYRQGDITDGQMMAVAKLSEKHQGELEAIVKKSKTPQDAIKEFLAKHKPAPKPNKTKGKEAGAEEPATSATTVGH